MSGLPEHRNALLVKRFYEAFANEDWRTNVAQCLDHDVVWHVAGDNPLAGDFLGVDAVLGAMGRYSEHSDGSLTLDTKAVFADDEHAIAVHSATAQRGEFSYRAHEIDVFHLGADRVLELWSFSEDQIATDALWS
jgi:ketosteroid isomerase-like protein